MTGLLGGLAVAVWLWAVVVAVWDMLDTNNEPGQRVISMLAVWTLAGLPLLAALVLR